MSQQEPPKIEFPCENYPVKVMGERSDAYKEAVLNIFEKHAPGFDPQKINVRDSSKGTFNSITIFITATGIPQLQAIFDDLKKLPATRMVI